MVDTGRGQDGGEGCEGGARVNEEGYGSRSAYLDALALAVLKTREAMEAGFAYWSDLSPYKGETEQVLSGTVDLIAALKEIRKAQYKAEWWPEEEDESEVSS